MANILNINNFEGGELNISGTEATGNLQTSVRNKVLSFITKYEPEYLLKALGYPLYKLFIADTYPNPETPRFQQLLNGNVEYTDRNNHIHLWTGLKANNGNILNVLSPIANYVYYWYNRDNATFSTSMGEAKGTAENVTMVPASTKMVRAWNEMSRTTESLQHFLKYAETAGSLTYPEFDPCQAQRFTVINKMNI